MISRNALFLVWGGLLTGARPIAAQRGNPERPEVALLGAIIGAAAPEMARAAFSTGDSPWEVKLSLRSVPSEAVRQHVLRMLQARPISDADDEANVLHVTEYRLSADTLHLGLEIGRQFRCRDRKDSWVISGRAVDLRLVRTSGSWRHLPSETLVMIDPGVCP